MAPTPLPARRSVPRWFVPLVAVVGLAFGIGGYRVLFRGETPEGAWAEVSAAAAAGDYGAVWDRVDPSARAGMAARLREFAAEADPRGAAALTDRDRFSLWLSRAPDARALFLPAAVVSVRVAGDYAVV